MSFDRIYRFVIVLGFESLPHIYRILYLSDSAPIIAMKTKSAALFMVPTKANFQSFSGHVNPNFDHAKKEMFNLRCIYVEQNVLPH